MPRTRKKSSIGTSSGEYFRDRARPDGILDFPLARLAAERKVLAPRLPSELQRVLGAGAQPIADLRRRALAAENTKRN